MTYKECYEMLKLNKTRGMRRTSWQNNLILTIDKSNSIVYNYNWLYCFTKEDLEASDWEIV
ncbi:MAG: hypothetical protein ACI31R_00645 [Bacilli bacterium]